jgi:tetraacyldisaccharide 4'-kinase
VVITRCDQVRSLDALRSEISKFAGNRPIFHSHMRTSRVSSLKNGPGALSSPARLAAFCAIGNPLAFFEDLRRSGYELVLQKSFPDHHVFSQEEIDSLIRAAKEAGANSLITTAKDAVKLRTMSFSIPCYVLEIEIAIENADELARMLP